MRHSSNTHRPQGERSRYARKYKTSPGQSHFLANSEHQETTDNEAKDEANTKAKLQAIEKIGVNTHLLFPHQASAATIALFSNLAVAVAHLDDMDQQGHKSAFCPLVGRSARE